MSLLFLSSLKKGFVVCVSKSHSVGHRQKCGMRPHSCPQKKGGDCAHTSRPIEEQPSFVAGGVPSGGCIALLKGRVILPLCILLLLSGCSQAQYRSDSPNTPTTSYAGVPISTDTPSPSPSAPVSTPTPFSITSGPIPLGTSVNFDLGGSLHIQSVPGLTCRVSTGDNAFLPGTLVLPRVLPTYDQGTLQSLKNYLTNAYQTTSGGKLDTVPYPPFSANPEAFQLVSVGSGECHEILQVANKGEADVQITQIQVQLTTDTHINSRHYNLINFCSVESSLCVPGGGGEPGYIASFDLHLGRRNTLIPATCLGTGTSAANCTPQVLTLRAGEVAQVDLSYNATGNFAFSLLPSFTLNWLGTGKQTTYPAPKLHAAIAFASVPQFSCYTLQGQRFVDDTGNTPTCI